jgi:Flp pilus assembly protein TadG
LVTVLFGLVEFGLAMYTKGLLANATREGARFGVVLSTPRKSQADITAKVREYLQKAGFSEAGTVPVTFPDWPAGASGQPLTVRVEYSYSFQILPRLVQDLVGPINLTAETVMLME